MVDDSKRRTYLSSAEADPGGAPGARPPKIVKNMICWRKILIFHTKYPKNFRLSLRSAQFFQVRSLTWNPGSAPDLCNVGLGTEFHFLFECTSADVQRLICKCIPIYYTR